MLKTLTVSLIFLSMAACNRSPCDVPGPSNGSVLEQSFSSPEGGFKIGLPPARPVPQEPNEIPTTRFNWFVLNHGKYEVSYFDAGQNLENEGDTGKVFDNLRDLLLSKAPGNLEVDKDLMLSGHPGRELKIKDEKGINIRRFYLVGQRVYSVAVFIPTKLECAVEAATKVLDSFEFLNENSVADASAGNPTSVRPKCFNLTHPSHFALTAD